MPTLQRSYPCRYRPRVVAWLLGGVWIFWCAHTPSQAASKEPGPRPAKPPAQATTKKTGAKPAKPPAQAATKKTGAKPAKPPGQAATKSAGSKPATKLSAAETAELNAIKPGYKHALTYASLATSFGGYIPLGEPEREGAFVFDLDLGARFLFVYAPWTDKPSAPFLSLWPVVGYTHVPQRGYTMHLGTIGLGFGIGKTSLMHYQGQIAARFVIGSVGDRLYTGGQVDLQFSLLCALGLSVGYQVLAGRETLHGIRLMAMLDLGSLISVMAHFSGHFRTRSKLNKK